MVNQQAVVDQIVQNLAFDVEAIPKKDLSQTTSTTLNVKIKVRKKDEIHNMQHDIAMADNASRTKQKIRLVNSDRTIMTFDVFMEAEFEKKPARKLRKHIFDMLRPGICLGDVDDNEYPYMPSSSYSANITKPSVTTKSDGTSKQTFTLTKNVYTVSTQPEGQKWLFGKCKPGGCLDPPFGEDKYSYKPSKSSVPERKKEALLEAEDVGTVVDSNKKPITLHDEETQSNGRHSSVFDSGLFKKKRKSSDKSTSTKISDKTDSIVDIYQKESVTNSVSTLSNSIITYPPKIKTDPRISDDKTARSRGPSEDKSRKSFNDHSEPYFVPPKGVQRIKEKEKLDLNNQAKHRSADVADVRHSLKESFKMPVPLPIPIPVPIPTISSNRTPEVIGTNDDILKEDSIPDHKLQNKESLNQELQDQPPQYTINLKDTETPPLLLRTKSASGDTDDKPVKSSKKETSIPSNIKQPNASNKIDDQNLNQIKLELLEAQENIKEDTAQPSKQKKTESFKIPIPVPLPFNFSDSNRTDAADTPFEGSKDMQQSIDPRLGENESVGKKSLNLEYSNIIIIGDEIPEMYLRTRGDFTEQESNTEIPVTLGSTMENDIERDSDGERSPDIKKKPEKQKDNRDNAEMPITKYTQEDVNPHLESRFGGVEITEGIEKPAKQKDTQEDIKRDFEGIKKPEEQQEDIKAIIEADIKRVSKEDTITDGMKIPAKQDNIKDKITPSAIYTTEDDRIRDSEVEKNIDGIGKPEQQKYFKDKATIPTKYAGDISDVHGKDKNRLSLPSEPEYETDTEEDIKRDIEGIKKPEEQQVDYMAITEEDIKRVSKEDTITDGMKIPAKQDDIKDKITPSAIYTTEEDSIRDSEEEKIIDGIGKLEQQKYFKDKATIPTKYAGDSSDVHGKDKNRLSLPSEPEYETDTQEDIKRDFDGIKKPKEQQEDIMAITEEDIKRVSKEDTIADGMEIQAKQDYIKDKITPSAIYTTEEDRIRDSEGEKFIDGIGKPEQQKYIKDKATIPTKYAGDSSNVHGKDETRSSLPSEPEYETDTGDYEMSKPHRNKENETTITNKDDHIDSHTGGQTKYTSEGAMDIIAAPVIIDNNTEPTSMFKPVKDDYSETNLFSGVPITTKIVSRFKEFDDESVDLETTASQELVGTKSVVYHSDGFVPSTSTKKHAERTPSYDKRLILPEDTVLTSIQSIGTLKSAIKNDTISIDLGFHSYLNKNNERIVQTFDSANTPKRLPNDSVTVIKSQIRLSSNEIRIAVDSEHDMTIEIKKANANQRVSISESRLVNVIDTGKMKKHTSPEQNRDVATRSFEPETEGTNNYLYESAASADRLLDYYEKELVPLQLTITNLRDEIDFLATQQSMFRDKLYCPNKSKLPRLVHSNKKCFGCVKK